MTNFNKNMKKILLTILLTICIIAIPQVYVYADSGVTVVGTGCVDTTDPTGASATGCAPDFTDLSKVLAYMVSVIYAFVQLTFFIMILVNGFHFLASRGDPKEMSAARSGLTNSIIGFFIVMVAYIIVTIIANISGLSTGYTFMDPTGHISFNIL